MCTHTCVYTHEHTHLHGHTHTHTLLSGAALNVARSGVAPVLCRSISSLSTAWFSRKTLGPKSAGRSLASPPLPPPVSVSALRGGHTQGACQQRTWTSHSPAGWTSKITEWGDASGNPLLVHRPMPPGRGRGWGAVHGPLERALTSSMGASPSQPRHLTH